MNVVHLLDQNEFWIASGGVKIPLAKMDADHRACTLAMLRRRAEYNHMMYHLTEEQGFLHAPDEIYDEWARTSARSLADDPRAWLERRPLVMELARLVRADGAVGGEIVPSRNEIGTTLHETVERYVKELESGSATS